jgi:SlyX protein
MEQRLTELETRMMYQERSLQELNDIVYKQAQTIERHEREMEQLRNQMQSVLPGLVGSADDEAPPPHY